MTQVCGRRHSFLIDNTVGIDLLKAASVLINEGVGCGSDYLLLKSKERLLVFNPAQTCFYLFTESDEEVCGGGEGPADFSRLAARDGRAPGHTDVLAPVQKAAGPSVTWIPGLQR
ncbi:hypothetical protein BTJ39_05300 [Izhakiella australiensis]|uniref:Uncharacterized protein n=1 Tax=Izhakiella australiensis TaxID=1926881 RepID=A0A1S8YR47_9GAMM|nr:hypothetical protein BTJ39_05300 [Izhakiella australiensis]